MQGQETTPLKPTRASFIRGLPETMPVAEVIERGREAGLDINPSDVHSARYYMRQGGGLQPASKSGFAPSLESAPSGPAAEPTQEPAKENASPAKFFGAHQTSGRRVLPKVAKARPPQPVAALSSSSREIASKPRSKKAAQEDLKMEEQLRVIVMRLGTDRAREIIEEVEELALRE
jgi:hypothetical protein